MGSLELTNRRFAKSVKIVVAGGFGVGKTTTVAGISEIPVLTTEAALTDTAAAIDGGGQMPPESSATVAVDFGRITLDDEITLYLFGAPDQDPFGCAWSDVTEGALGALVIVHTHRLAESYPVMEYFTRIGLPFVIGVNQFNGRLEHDLEDIRRSLTVSDDVPLITFDARSRESVRQALIAVLQRALVYEESRA